MTRLQEDRISYSTLERFRDDDTVRAPQALGPATTVGFDHTPELDGANSAPEVSKFAWLLNLVLPEIGAPRNELRSRLQYSASRSYRCCRKIAGDGSW